MNTRPRTILHVDMDAFYASVEQADHPEWRGKPVIVGSLPDRRGVVATCSYEARKFGVRSAMPSRQAYELCPQGMFVRPRMQRYTEASHSIFEIFHEFSPLVEGLSIDEAFLDISSVQRLFGSPNDIAKKIQARILAKAGVTCSIGIAPNKFLAKLASEENKPNGIFAVPTAPAALLSWLGQKSIRALWGIGPVLATHLEAHGFHSVRDLQSANPEALRALLTESQAGHLLNICFGRDSRPVSDDRPDKSFSRERTYETDITDTEQMRRNLREIAEDVGRRLRAHGLWSKTGRIKIRYTGFRTITRQAKFATPACDDFALRDMAWNLFEKHIERDIPVRLIGFGADDLTDSPNTLPEDDLFAAAEREARPREKIERLFRTLDAFRSGQVIPAANAPTPLTPTEHHEPI